MERARARQGATRGASEATLDTGQLTLDDLALDPYLGERRLEPPSSSDGALRVPLEDDPDLLDGLSTPRSVRLGARHHRRAR
jgi:hypothetical protein